ncbi:MAG: hypothetical protein JJ895_14810 [Balneolaceae bacterium]|nr:hypothetical protein [Balneolaceae bacterium]
MSQKHRYSQHLDNNHSEDDFDLDSYLEEKGGTASKNEEYSSQEEPKNNTLLNGFLLAIALIASVYWSYDVTTSNNWFGIFGSDEAALISDVPRVAPTAPLPPLPPSETATFNFASNSDLGSVTDYLQNLDQRGLLNDRLLNAFEARQIYQERVPIEYLEALNEAGYLSEFSFVEINEFYKNQIPMEYLDVLNTEGYLNHFSFVSVVELYKNDVSLDYLKQLEEGGYLFDLSFVYITEYYKNGVTTEFLDDLKSKELYDNLSFIDVVELYKAQEN